MVIIMLNSLKTLLANLSLYWDIEKQYYHKNDKLRRRDKSLYGKVNFDNCFKLE